MKWYKRDPEAFKVGTMGLTLEECGFYTTILDLMYSTDDHCPNDDRFLSRLLLGTNVRTVRRLKGRLIELGKLRIGSDGFLHNGRVSSEIAEWQHRMELRRARMAKVSGKFEPSLGAVSGMFGDNVTEKSNEINETFLKSDRTTTTTTKISKKESRAIADAMSTPSEEEFEEFWKRAYPKRAGANRKAPARKLFLAFVKAGVDPQAMIAGARAYATDPSTKVGTEFVAMAETWLRARGWEDYTEQVTIDAGELERHRQACLRRNDDGKVAGEEAGRHPGGGQDGAGDLVELRSESGLVRLRLDEMGRQVAVSFPRPGTAWNGR
jgi:uncharacterized protein YdaU (DUF1376 family)